MYALTDHGSQFTFLLDTIANFLALPSEAQTSTTLQHVNTQNEMQLSKITAPVIITPYKSLRQSFEICRAYSTPAMNVTTANIFELNQICDMFNNLRRIHFPQLASGKIGALLVVNTFAYAHPIEVIPGNINQPFGVKTKLGWTLAGDYEALNPSESTFRHLSTANKPFIYHVSRQQTEEPHLSQSVEQFWKMEREGTQKNSSVLSDEDNGDLKFFRKTIRHNSERYEIRIPWKMPCLLENNYYCALNQLRCLEKRLGNNPTLKEKYDQTLSTDLIKKYKKTVEMREPEPEKIWHLPHHPVQNPNKPEKIRWVANVASKYRGQSLNSNLQNEMQLSKITATVIITPYKSLRQSFEICRAYSTPAMNVTTANIFELNQICDMFNNLRRIHFPQLASGKIGALLVVNTFAYAHPIEVIPGNINQPFGVKTKLGWALAGDYEALNPSESTFRHLSTANKPFIYHVSRQQTEEPHLSQSVEQFWKMEREGTQKNSSVLSDEDNGDLKFFRKTIRHNSERYEIRIPWKMPCLLEKKLLLCS